MRNKVWLYALLILSSLGVSAQQTGSMNGEVTGNEGEALVGVVVSATSEVLPQPRGTVSNGLGKYRLPALPPGDYEVTFIMDGFMTQKKRIAVYLDRNTHLNVAMTLSTVQENIEVVARTPLVDNTSSELQYTASNEIFKKIPLGQDYRDLVRLAPGIQVTEMNTRGPSAGGNGQDNVYKFDGVDVTLPLFGTLSAQPSNHDIDQVSIVKGGAKAVNFNRSGGFLINSISKSGTNKFKGDLAITTRSSDWVADEDRPSTVITDERERIWASLNFGGPLVTERLFFFASYFAPQTDISERRNVYGDHPDGSQDREEIFAKLTFSPASNFTLHTSYRSSNEDYNRSNIGSLEAPGLAGFDDSKLALAVIEGDWILNSNQILSFNYTDMQLDTSSSPEFTTNAIPSRELGSTLDLANLHTLGVMILPTDSSNPLYVPYIERYGYLEDGEHKGGGVVGVGTSFNNQDFSRTAFQAGWDYFLPFNNLQHDLHIGFRHTEESEELSRRQQGFGTITFLSTVDELFRAEYLRTEGSDPIVSEYQSDNIEMNDTISWDKWSVNLGVLLSNDTLYGQDLAPDSTSPSGYRVELGHKYKMYELDWTDMIQPRLGFVRQLRANETFYGNFALYNPMANSLPRAASWARNRRNLVVRNYYNSDGVLVRTQNRGATSGKFFQEDMTPRQIEEYLMGYSRQLDSGWTFKLTSRYREGAHFWEDTENNARTAFYVTAPEDQQAAILARGLYVPSLDLYRFGEEGQDNGVGGSSYVIAELDGAITKYIEHGFDVEKRGEGYYLKGTYTWSHYYGNFDQDNTTTNNDQNLFIGSSNLADGVGRQLWDFKYGNLKGDRRHLLKIYGSYDLSWGASLGAFAIYQSGEPWETSDVEYYREYTGSSSSTNRFSEPAGSRTGPSHHQLDLNYTHRFKFTSMRLALNLEIFNLFDNQTDYNLQTKASSVNFGVGQNAFEPRSIQVGATLDF